jgi:uncharacterized membrane protein YhiD involved in acid resistance
MLFAQYDAAFVGTAIGAIIMYCFWQIVAKLQRRPLEEAIKKKDTEIDQEKSEKERIKIESDKLYDRLTDFAGRLGQDNVRLGNSIEALHLNNLAKDKTIADQQREIQELKHKLEATREA